MGMDVDGCGKTRWLVDVYSEVSMYICCDVGASMESVRGEEVSELLDARVAVLGSHCMGRTLWLGLLAKRRGACCA